jgi:starch synthase
MAAKIAEDGISLNDISVIKDPSFVNLSKLAIDYSDATIKGSENINTEVESYMKESKKPFLDYQSKETYIDSYFDFYDTF